MKIKETVRQKRRAKNLSQLKLAELSGISKSAIANLENGRNAMTSDNLDKIFEILDINLT